MRKGVVEYILGFLIVLVVVIISAAVMFYQDRQPNTFTTPSQNQLPLSIPQISTTSLPLPSPSMQSIGLITYVNKLLQYSFQYTVYEKIETAGGYEGFPEESETIVIVDRANENDTLMSIKIEIPPTGRYLKDEQEAIDEIVSYWSSSTSQFFEPQLNTVNGPTKTMDSIKNPENQPVPKYRYDINWKNEQDNSGENGTVVWLFIPIVVDWRSDPDRLNWLKNNYTFLWIEYEKQLENRLQPILNSFTLSR